MSDMPMDKVPAVMEEVVFLPPVRRIVTGHDEQGRSIIVSDGPSPHSNAPATVPELVARVMWITEQAPATNAGNEDAAPAGLAPPIAPPESGTIFRIADFPPDS